MDNTKYFYISGFISLSLFLLFAILMFFTLFSSSKLKVYALKKDTYISISIQMPKKVQKKTTHRSSKKVSKPKVKNDIVEPKDVSIDDLFSDVWTKTIKNPKKKKKTLNKRRLLEIQKKSKLIDKNEIKPILQESDEKVNLESKEDKQSASTANEVNEYRAKIQAIVYENFNPPANSAGNIVVAYIKINAIGKMLDFRILKYSANEELNKECDKMKLRLLNVLFPINPQNKTFTTKINLIPEDK
jgi:protein TonB